MASETKVIRYLKACTCSPASASPEMWHLEETADGFTLTITMPPVVYCTICGTAWKVEANRSET